MSSGNSTDLRNQQFNWDLLYNLYKPQLSDEVISLSLFQENNVHSIFANFLIAYSYEKGSRVEQNRQKALEIYKYSAFHLLDPLSCYRLAELYTLKNDFDIDSNFQYTWFYLLIFTSTIEPIYDLDFFKGVEWLQRIIKQADPTFTNSFNFIKEMIDPSLEPLCQVIQNLVLLKLNITYEEQTNQQRYTDIIEQLISILGNEQTESNVNLLYCSYNILFGLCMTNFNQITNKHSDQILDALSLQIHLTFNKIKELQIESVFSKFQMADNFFSQRLRRSMQQIFWIGFNIKQVHGMQIYEQSEVISLNNEQRQMIEKIDEISGNILEVIYCNTTIKERVDLILCRRIHAKLLYVHNKNLEQAVNVLSQELQTSTQEGQSQNISNNNTKAYAEYLLSKIYLKLKDQESASYFSQASHTKFCARIEQESTDGPVLLQSYFFKGRIESFFFNDQQAALNSFIAAVQTYVKNYDTFQKQSSFQHILFQKRSIKNIIKITKKINLVDELIQYAKQMNVTLQLPYQYYQIFNKNKQLNFIPNSATSICKTPKSSLLKQPIQNKTYSFGTGFDNQNKLQNEEIQFLGIKYEICEGDDEIEVSRSSWREENGGSSNNVSQMNTSSSSLSKQLVQDFNLGSSLSSFQSVTQYNKNQQLNQDQQFVFSLTKQYVLNECKMILLENKDLKMKNLIRKGDVGGIYGVRYNEEYYACKLITYISKKQLEQFLQFSNQLPHAISLLNILAYSISTNNQGAVNLYLISEIKNSNLSNLMFKGQIIKLEQKLKIIDQLLNCIQTLHSKNIYHSNIKDTNILLDTHSNIYLSDLAVTRVFKDYEFGENSFKQPYAAPEQVLESEPVIGKQNDMWAIGIIALQLFTNVKSYTPELINSQNIYSKVDFKMGLFSQSPLPEINKIENMMTSFIESLLRFEPKKRANAQQAATSFGLIKTTYESIKLQKS